jgi:predicted branched-subunit amino acid permease
MVLLLLVLMFSCSYSFGYVMEHPGMSYWYPIIYTMVVFASASAPEVFEFFSIRKRDDKPSRGRCHQN